MVKTAYMIIDAGNQRLGRLDLILYETTVPRTVQNFLHFLLQEPTKSGMGYRQCCFHRIIRGFMAQGGDVTHGDGTGGNTSLYGKTTTFADESFQHGHDRRGVISMANAGKDTNGSQFFITFRPTPHLNGKHVVFGHVDLSTSEATLQAMEHVPTTTPDDRPVIPITIVECGVIDDEKKEEEEEEEANEANGSDENQIDLNDDDDGEKKAADPNFANDNSDEIELPDEEEEEEGVAEDPPKSKAEELRRRMRKLKMKMNQARQLNKQEVLKEGERLGSVEGAAKARKRQMMQDKKLQEAAWQSKNARALQVAKEYGVDGKHLAEQAELSLVSEYFDSFVMQMQFKCKLLSS